MRPVKKNGADLKINPIERLEARAECVGFPFSIGSRHKPCISLALSCVCLQIEAELNPGYVREWTAQGRSSKWVHGDLGHGESGQLRARVDEGIDLV